MTAPLAVRDSQGRPVALGTEIGGDDQDAVFLVTRRPESVAKVFLETPDARTAEKLLAMVRVRSAGLESVCAWPTATLHDAGGKACGFLMSAVNLKEYHPIQDLYFPNPNRNDFPQADDAFQVRAARRVAQAFAAIHRAGQVIGNVSGRQILLSRQAQVRMVGCETFQVQEGEQVYPCTASQVELTPPELQGKGITTLRNENHDLFGLAVLLFYLLMRGQHPYSGVFAHREMPSPAEAIGMDAFAYAAAPRPGVKPPPQSLPLTALPAPIQALFERAFSPSHENRPSAAEWDSALEQFQDDLASGSGPRSDPLTMPNSSQSHAASSPVAQPHAGLPERIQRLWQQILDINPPDKPILPPQIRLEPALPPLPLNLPDLPRSLLGSGTLENILRWTLRIGVLALIMGAVIAVQKSVLAGMITVVVIVLILTVGRRISVDWDGIIHNFQNWEGRLIDGMLPAQGKWQAYHAALEERRKQVQGQVLELAKQVSALEDRYRDENAYATYQREMSRLDASRRRLQSGQGQSADSQNSALERHAERALAEYLKRQVVQPNTVPKLTSRAAMHLSTMGIRRASDIVPDKLKLIRGDMAEVLMIWRQHLIKFFQFDPSSIPPRELEQIQRAGQEQFNNELRQFDRGVRAFASEDWRKQDGEILEELTNAKRRLEQHKQALKALDKLADE